MIRILDVIISIVGAIICLPIILLIIILSFIDTGSPIFIQERLGRNLKSFKLYKFRTMKIGTASVATHLANYSDITSIGVILRKTKLDELPQLWNVLIGDMSIVGPRPCLASQKEVIAERESLGVINHRPGITGLAQIKGIDMSNPKLLAKLDSEMVENLNIFRYFYYIGLTFMGRGMRDGIKK